jgi:4-hydroxybenzoate polyprenyltransferase
VSVAAESRSTLLAWLRLFRLPNIFTAFADVAMGFVITQHGLTPAPTFVALLLASGFLYTAGMILNDVFDVAQDTRERPQRPIPAGQISLGTARFVGFAFLLLGVACAGAAGYLPGSDAAFPWRSGLIAGLLALCVVLYDIVLKKTPVGPVFMALCRFFNVLLGMSCASERFLVDRPATLYFPDGYLLVAAALATYVLGITLFARTEATESNRPALVRGMAIMGFGIAILLLVQGRILPPGQLVMQRDWLWPALLLMLAISIGRHCVNAISSPSQAKVQWAVKFALLSIITLDAAVALLGAGPLYALGIFALVVPMMALGRFVYST